MTNEEKMKLYTELDQSKKLTEILPEESADHFHVIGHMHTDGPRYEIIVPRDEVSDTSRYWPCWSFAALLEQIPEKLFDNDGFSYELEITKQKGLYYINYLDSERNYHSVGVGCMDTLVDACYELVLNLNELKML